MNWFFTFGANHTAPDGSSLGHRYVLIEGEYEEARTKLFEVRGAVFAFQYPESELAEQKARWNLKEISLEELAV